MAFNFLKCGTHSLQNAAMVVAILDVLCTSILLILFVLGTSMMLAFEIIGKPKNATRVLDVLTDEVFGQRQDSYNTVREKKDVAEDMGVFLIIFFLTIVDFIISCIFLDGVKSKNANKCQIWLNIRMVIIVVFKIVVLINLVYGTSFVHAIPDMIFTIYRIIGLFIGYHFLQELRSSDSNFNTIDEQQQQDNKGNGSLIPTIAISDVDGSPNGNANICPHHGSMSSLSSVGITMNEMPDKNKGKISNDSAVDGHSNPGFQMEEVALEELAQKKK